MNPFDRSIIVFLNGFAHHWSVLDRSVVLMATGAITKGCFLALFVWWPWFEVTDQTRRNREVILATVIACIATIAVGLVVQKAVPFRVRPIQNPDLHFVVPYGQEPLEDWPSAFPSDHAMLFSTLAMATFFIRPWTGVLAHLFAAVFIGLPRIYLGLHHPSDLLAGAALGILLGAVANHERVRATLTRHPMRWLERHPGPTGAILFLLLLQISTVFWEVRVVAGAFLDTVRGH
jgi:membrane-associated phospholipid phosphatase